MQNKQKYIKVVVKRLEVKYRKEMKTSLEHENPWELLVATMLSAQTQDRQVNKVTKPLFKRYSTVKQFANLKPRQLYPYVRHLNLYKGKARHIIATANILKRGYDSKVPKSIKELIELPGVGRKTANVVLHNAYGIDEGIAVDTHVITVANRLGLVRTRDPVKIERRLMEILPENEWNDITHLLIALGRDTCTARVKYCYRCVLKDICPSSNAN